MASGADIKIRIKGVDRELLALARTDEEHKLALLRGINEAANMVKRAIEEKFGTYQNTGGSGNGPWKKLAYDTMKAKIRRFGFSGKPLIGTGKMKESFYIKPGGKGTFTASIASNDPKMAYHVYGAPRVHLPQRDPMIVTAEEKRDECYNILLKEVYKAYAD